MIKRIINFFLCKELISYSLVGLLGAVLDFIAFILLIMYGTEPLIAQWFAAMLGFSHNHFWHHFLVFKHNQEFKKTYPFSMAITLVAVALSGPLLVLLARWIENIWLNKAVIMVIFMILIFVVRKKWIFIKK